MRMHRGSGGVVWLPLISNAMHQWKWLPGCRSSRIYILLGAGGTVGVSGGSKTALPSATKAADAHARTRHVAL